MFISVALVVIYKQIEVPSLPPQRYLIFLALVLGLGVLASLFPDVDVHSSKARQGLGQVGLLGALGIAGIVLIRYPNIILESLSQRLPSVAGNPVVLGVGFSD